jgi:hypothetical protein
MQYFDYMTKTQEDDDSFSSAELIAAYHQGIEDLRSAVAGMTPDHILARPIAGKWSTQEVVSHLADTEIYYTDRIERTIALERPLLIGVDERPYPERRIIKRSTWPSNSTSSRPCGVTLLESCECNRPRRGIAPPSTARPASSRCGNWYSRLCGTCATTCRSSPKSGRRWKGLNVEQGEPARKARTVQRPLESEDHRRIERPASEARQVPGRVHLAQARSRGRVFFSW